jgi:hypothetical protein
MRNEVLLSTATYSNSTNLIISIHNYKLFRIRTYNEANDNTTHAQDYEMEYKQQVVTLFKPTFHALNLDFVYLTP